MMRLIAGLALVFALVASAVGVWATPPDKSAKLPPGPPEWESASTLRAWVGKYPSDKVKGVALLQVPQLATKLQATFGPVGLQDMRAMGVAGPIIEQKGWLVAGSCMAHDCANQQWVLAVNLSTYAMMACITRDVDLQGKMVRVRWAGTGKPRTERIEANPPERCPADIATALPKFAYAFAHAGP